MINFNSLQKFGEILMSGLNKDDMARIMNTFLWQPKKPTDMEAFKKTRDKMINIIQKRNPNFNMEEFQKNPKNEPSIKKSSKNLIKLLDLDTLKDIGEYFLKDSENITENQFLMAQDFDQDLYYEFKDLFNKAKSINLPIYKKALDDYNKRDGIITHINMVLDTLLVVRDNNLVSQYPNKASWLAESGFTLFTDYNIEPKILKEYVFDWVLKYAYLLEGAVFNLLRFLVKIYWINSEEEDIENLVKESNTWKFYKFLNEIKIKGGLNQYRNKIFHSSFNIEVGHGLLDCNIWFEGIEEKLPLKDFTVIFGKLVALVKTFELAIAPYTTPIIKLEGIKELINEFSTLNKPKELLRFFENISFMLLNPENRLANEKLRSMNLHKKTLELEK